MVVCDEAEKIYREFIWGTTANQRKIHLISWDKTCRLKSNGDLDFKSLGMLNMAYMIKLSWQFIAYSNKLLVNIMRAKYALTLS